MSRLVDDYGGAFVPQLGLADLSRQALCYPRARVLALGARIVFERLRPLRR
ncbi:MAG: hypothetical protein HY270_13600 [Deltaproteobacteria bacterium]|nr:hypothetical protein [Deltaproteobacteria bacterium]